MRAFVLAGGLGTRLRPRFGDLPKALAPLAGRPFLVHLLEWLRDHGVRDAVLCVGYGADQLRAALGEGGSLGVTLRYSIEAEPLGTGGALRHAAAFVNGPALVVNGDTLVSLDPWALERERWERGLTGAIALYPVADASSRGRVECDDQGRVRRFVEKDESFHGPAWVNGGAYAFAPDLWEALPPGGSSLERDVLPGLAAKGELAGARLSGEFFDIGTPEEWERAERRFRVVIAPRYVRARAPLRLSFCGGGTDVSPYPEEHGGMVLSATINQYAFASLRPRRDSRFTLASLDYDVVAKYDHPRRMRLDGNLDLIKSAVKALKVRRGADLWVHSDAPPGSGLGSSSTLVVAVIGALSEWLSRPISGYEAAELAYRIERVDLGLAGGRQDQYAAAFGGFNLIEFHKDSTLVNPLRIPRDVLQELEYRLLLCYMGQTRQSARIIERQVARYREGASATVEALHHLKELTLEMKKALLLGEIDAIGELLHEAWEHKKRLDEDITNTHVDRLYRLARREGAIGGKMPGAGGGGYFLFLTRFDRKHRVAQALEKHGGQVVPFQFESRGLMSWSSNSRGGRRALRARPAAR